MRLLVTNDDGIEASGPPRPRRRPRRRRARRPGRRRRPATTAATAPPSATSASAPTCRSTRRRARLRPHRRPRIVGPPALCVMAARLGGFGDPPDLVASGINPGNNTGRAVLHSGTVGAALTAANLGMSASRSASPSVAERRYAPPVRSPTSGSRSRRAALGHRRLRWPSAPSSGSPTSPPDRPQRQRPRRRRSTALQGVRWAELAAFGTVRAALGRGRAEPASPRAEPTGQELPPDTDTALVRRLRGRHVAHRRRASATRCRSRPSSTGACDTQDRLMALAPLVSAAGARRRPDARSACDRGRPCRPASRGAPPRPSTGWSGRSRAAPRAQGRRRSGPRRTRLVRAGPRRHPAGRRDRRRGRHRRVPQPRRPREVATARHGEALVGAAVDELLAAAVAGRRGDPHARPLRPPRRVLSTVPPDARPPAARVRSVVIEDITEPRRLDAVRRDFVANLSHELKTPVGAIGLLAETLLAEPDPDVAHRLTERVVNESFRVSRTIDDLLELSRIEAEPRPSASRCRPPGRSRRPPTGSARRPSCATSPIEVGEVTARVTRGRRPPPAGVGRGQPARQRGQVLRRRRRPSRCAAASDGTTVDDRRRGPRHRHPRPRRRARSSSASTGSTGPAAATPAAPASAWPSSATSWPTTAARSPCSSYRGPGLHLHVLRSPPAPARRRRRPVTAGNVPTNRPAHARRTA